MIVVSDTSPLVNLAAIGKLDLLHQLYGKILVPDAVYREIVQVGAGEPGAYEVAIFGMVHSRRIVLYKFRDIVFRLTGVPKRNYPPLASEFVKMD